MTISALPQRISNYIIQDRHFPQKPIFAQVATQSNSQPHIRTMRLYGIDDNGELIFLTHGESQKCEDLRTCQNVEVLIYDETHQIQIKAAGHSSVVKLSEYKGGILYWNQVPDQVKKLYSSTLETDRPIPDSCLAIIVSPQYWEYYQLNLSNYSSSPFFQYHSSSHWVEEGSYIRT
jgi:general stress protein 26